MTISDITKARGIRDVVHFTTHKGLLGILQSGFVKSRKRLPAEMQLEYIYTPNAPYRKDVHWVDFINLSISSINHQYFNASCRWHREADVWWCILSFDPIILTHTGVYFTTTNNIYTGVQRGTGAAALEKLFANQVVRWIGNVQERSAQYSSSQPTCPQAEVLYPGELSIDYLRRVHVEKGEDEDEVHAQLSLVRRTNIEVAVDSDKFKP